MYTNIEYINIIYCLKYIHASVCIYISESERAYYINYIILSIYKGFVCVTRFQRQHTDNKNKMRIKIHTYVNINRPKHFFKNKYKLFT